MTLDLQAIFGEPAAALAIGPTDGETSCTPRNRDSEPQPTDAGPSDFDPADWTRTPDAAGRMGWQRRDLDPGDWADFDELPNPAPCPACDSLEMWQPIAGDLNGAEPGGWRCLKCDPPAKSRALAARAAQLRQQTDNRNPWRN